ncbi:MAG: TetR/AcrR family transcriptional regulator [Solimonas sp.]
MNENVKSRTPERNEQRRRQILDAAADCFQRRGFHAASMAEISKAAGMSVGHIYHYFANKEAIIRAMVEARAQEIVEKMDAMRRHPDLPAAMVEKADEGLDKNLERNSAALKIEILAEAARNPAIHETLCASDRVGMGKLKEILQAAAPALAGDPRIVEGRVAIMAALFDGLAIRALLQPDADRTALLAALRVAIRALLSEPAGAPNGRAPR